MIHRNVSSTKGSILHDITYPETEILHLIINREGDKVTSGQERGGMVISVQDEETKE